jgi:hypothetical protein
MIRKTLFAAILAVSTSPAFAFQCPGDMAKIDAALQTAQLSDADKATVMELRAKGDELHSAGQHQESVDTLAEALKILGM